MHASIVLDLPWSPAECATAAHGSLPHSYAMLCCAMLRYAMLRYAMLRCAVLCCAVLCCAVPRYAVSCYGQGTAAAEKKVTELPTA